MKKMYASVVTAMVGVIGLTASSALAAENGMKANYAQIKLGYFQPDGQLDDAGYDDGGDIAVVYGRNLTPFLGIEAGIDIIGAENSYSGSNSTVGAYDQDNILSATGATLTLKAKYPVGPVSFYGGAGFGVYSVSLYSELDTARLGDFDKTDSDGMLGAHAVAGIDWDITDRLFVSLEGKYRVTEDVEIDETVASVPVTYSGDLDGYSIAAGVGFRF